MTKLSQYCKSYYLKDLQAYPGWRARPVPGSDTEKTGAPDLGIVFLHQDFTITVGIARDEDVLYESTDPAWIAYCRDVLKFEVPAWCEQPASQGK